jgi:hypothetical protein
MDLTIKLSKSLKLEPLSLLIVTETKSSLIMLKKEISGECAKLNKTPLKIGLNSLLPEPEPKTVELLSG